MNRREWLRQEIAAWQAEGLVDEPTAARLAARYQPEARRFSWGTLLASGFGALFIGLGLIAVFAANWDHLGRGARAALAIAPVAVCGLLALLGSLKKWTSMGFWEPLGIAWMVATIAGTSLVAQTYQVGGTVPSLILFIAVLAYPIAWVTRAMVPTTLWPLFAVVWTCTKCVTHGAVELIALEGVGFLLLSVPALVAFLTRKPARAARLTGLLLSGLIYTVGTGVMLCAAADQRGINDVSTFISIFWACSAVVAVAAGCFKLPVWGMLSLVVASVVGLFTVVSSDELPLYLCALGLAVGVVVWGVRTLRLSVTNIGAGLLLWLVLAKFFESRVDFTVKGIVLILAGVALTVFNLMFVRYRRGRV